MSEAINIGEFYEDLMQKVRVAGGDSEAFSRRFAKRLKRTVSLRATTRLTASEKSGRGRRSVRVGVTKRREGV